MSGLSPEARRLLMAARADAEPTAGDRARVHAMVVAAMTIPAASAAAATSVGTKVGANVGVGATSGLLAKLSAAALVTSLTVAGGYGAYTWSSRTTATETSTAPQAVAAKPIKLKQAPPTPVVAITPSATTPAGALETAAPSVSDATHKRRTATVGSERAAASTRSAQVAKEIVWISSAESALDQRAPALALQALQQHAQLFPQGELRQERLGLRAIAVCTLNRGASRTHVARTYLSQYPSSILAERVRDACRVEPARGAK